MKPCCYLCRRVLAPVDVAGTVDFIFATYPICKTCVEGGGVVTPAVGDVYEDRRHLGCYAKVEGVSGGGRVAMRTTQNPNPRTVGRAFHTDTATLARHWVRVDTTEEST